MKRKTKTRTLLVLEYPSGIVGEGKHKSKLVKSVFTPKQYEKRYYGSSEHFQTENAMKVYELKRPHYDHIKKKWVK